MLNPCGHPPHANCVPPDLSGQNKESEKKRVDKELANIRKHFKDATKLSPYQKKKYVWKMLYIYILGYEIDFGHMEALGLISAPTFPEKQVGYLACALLLNETADFLRLIINSVKNDLLSANEDVVGLALSCIGNIGGKEFAEALQSDVQKLFLSASSKTSVKKKAALALLRLFRKYPDLLVPESLKERLLALLDDRSIGVVLACMGLLNGLCQLAPKSWEDCVPKVCKLLAKLSSPTATRDLGQEYVYYGVVCPWLQVRLLRFLQYFPPPSDAEVSRRLCEVLSKILADTTVQKNVNKNNALHSVLFECVNLVITMEKCAPPRGADPPVRGTCCPRP
jgi:AP-2 complex subunit alpha